MWHSRLSPFSILTRTQRPWSEQERANLADQSQYAVLWKWSVNTFSWRDKKCQYEDTGDDWCRLRGKYKKLPPENSWHKKNHPCWWLLCFNKHQIRGGGEEGCAQLISYYHLRIYDLQLSVSPGEKDAAFTVLPVTIEVIWAQVRTETNVKSSCQKLMGFMWGAADTSATFSFHVFFPFKLLDL